jgi:DNA-cytosine methyltransferase
LIKYELINYCENDKHAKKAYSLIHNEPESKNLGDITLINEKEIADFNWMVGGSPCQDFSVAGKGKGAVWTCKDCKDDEGNDYQYNPLEVHYTKRDKCPKCNSTNIEKTRSSLVVEWLRILNEKKPSLAIYENVKNLVGKKHKYFFDLFIQELHEYGYNTYWKVLNAKNYGIPQNRERVYLIIIKKEIDNGKFKFPKGFDNGIRLKDLLEKEVDERYYISQEKTDKLVEQLKNKEISNTVRSGGRGSIDRHTWDLVAVQQNHGEVKIKEDDICSCIDANYYKGLDNHASRTGIMQIGNIVDTGNWDNPQRGRIYCQEYYDKNGYLPEMFNPYNQKEITDIAPTQTVSCDRSCSSATVLIKDIWYRIRKLIPLECFRLMGFNDEDFYILKENKISDSQIYKMAGNSIVVDVLYYIYLELYKAMPHLFEDIRLGSFFSGIGAFEKAIKRLQETINNQQ